MRKIAAVTVAFAALVTGCVTDPAELGSEEQEAGGCPNWVCGENSPIIDVWEFHELDEAGAPNLQNMRIIRMVKGSDVYTVDVTGARLRGLPTVPGQPSLWGANLAGANIELMTPGGRYDIQIKHVSSNTQYWTGNPNTVESYELAWVKIGGSTQPRNVCPRPPRSRLDPAGGLYGNTVEAFVFTGDRYDSATRTVTAASYAQAGTFFNIGCVGSSIAKLLLMRHATASSDSTHFTSAAQRQALLKMYTSDICPAGGAFTVAGTPLHYENPPKWFALTGFEASLEGFWGPNGAVCLENHRLSPTYDVDIQTICPGVPTCSSIIPSWPNVAGAWPSGAYLLSANP